MRPPFPKRPASEPFVVPCREDEEQPGGGGGSRDFKARPHVEGSRAADCNPVAQGEAAPGEAARANLLRVAPGWR